MELTDKQKEAVRSEGSVAVTAGAGTGKTSMLAARYLYHVVEHGLSPLEIAAVTFTEKAAAELRSRIREELRKHSGERMAAEVDASQISTIHSLASRICRDFPDVAGIPPDFTILDEIDREILHAAWHDEAIEEVDPEIVKQIGYRDLRKCLTELLKDPPAAEAALNVTAEEWKDRIIGRRETAIAALMSSDEWRTADEVLKSHAGHEDDYLEQDRQKALKAMEDIAARRDLRSSLSILGKLRYTVGKQANWPDGSIDLVRAAHRSLRAAAGRPDVRDEAGFEFGLAEEEMCRRMGLLRQAFLSVIGYFRGAKLELKLLDFSDLEHYAIRALDSPLVRDHYAERWKAIMVDEFQDTNPDQERLLTALVNENTRLTIVGDAKQSIFGFRRADPRVFERFRAKIGKEVVLDLTFRTHGSLVSSQNKTFEYLLGQLHQPLDNVRETATPGPHIRAIRVDNDSWAEAQRLEEAAMIAAEIQRLISEKYPVWDKDANNYRPVRPGDIAILSRRRAPQDIYVEKLHGAGIPAVNAGGGRLLETRVAMDMMALLRFAADPTDDIALIALLRGPFFAISDRELQKLATGRDTDVSWWRTIAEQAGAVAEVSEVLNRLLDSAPTLSANGLVELADQLTGYTAVISNLDQGDRLMADWFGFHSLLRRLAALGRADVFGADRYLREIAKHDVTIERPPIDARDAVTVMTIHKAKGLEWPVVFIADLGSGRKPDNRAVHFDSEIGAGFKIVARNENGKLSKLEPAMWTVLSNAASKREADEAARLLYVAMTRPRDVLFLTASGKPSSSCDLSMLEIGLDNAGVAIELVVGPISLPPRQTLQGSNGNDRVTAIDPVTEQLRRVTATGLSTYAECPRKFRYRFIDAHPGLAAGSGAKLIGSLTHRALQYGISKAADLRPLADQAPQHMIDEAIELAETFRQKASFGAFSSVNASSEVPLSLRLGDLLVNGVADLVGDDWVLDYKTDSRPQPAQHLIQLWSYARALGKSNAYIAYLRQGILHQFDVDDLDQAEKEAERAAAELVRGVFDATPSSDVCSACDWSKICTDRH